MKNERKNERKNARGHITKLKDETIHTTTWTHHQTPRRSTTQHSTSWRSTTDAILPGHREHTWLPAGHPRYTRADYDQEAVGGSTSRARARDTSHRHKLCTRVATKQPGSGVRVSRSPVHGSAPRNMVAEPSCEPRQSTIVHGSDVLTSRTL